MTLGEKMNQIKKMQKSTKKLPKKQDNKITMTSPDDEVRRFGLLVLIIVIILFLVYLISTILKGKDYSSIFDNRLDVNEIQYDEILIGTLFKQKEEKYYVVVMEQNDPYIDILKSYTQTYLTKENHEVLYTIDLDNLFNKGAKAEETNVDALTFNGSTLLLIENGEVQWVEEDSATICTELIRMTKELEET